jgi:hypothetical protein
MVSMNGRMIVVEVDAANETSKADHASLTSIH